MSLKKSILVLLTACFTLGTAAVMAAAPEINAQSACVIDANTGKELYAKDADHRMYPGGTTMIMTSLLGVESGKLDQPLTIAPASQQLPGDVSKLGLYAGDKVTLRHALTGMMTVGGCDAAIDAAVTVAPTEADFVQQMNAKAAALGATGTHFTNPTGLPDAKHYSTARDLAKIAAYAMQSSDFRGLVNHTSYDMPYMDSGTKHCETTNGFLTSGFSGANGVKTGVTNEGGPCLVASATRDGHTLVVSILNSQSRSADAQSLLTYGFSQLTDTTAPQATANTTSQAAAAPSKTAAAADTDRDAEEAYVLRNAPAGQTLSSIAAQQRQVQALSAANAQGAES